MIPKIGNNRENKLRSAFSSIPKPDIEEATGKTIKSNIQGVLSKKYGELDTRHVFDSVPNKDIAKSVARAENTIQTNIDKGLLNSNYSKKFPHLRDGLALSYAAADKGNSRAATRAREAAYTEGENNSNILPSPSPSLSKPNNGKLDGIIQNNGGKRYVGGDGVRIRNTPGITAENILGLLNKGNEVNYTGRKTSEKDETFLFREERVTREDLGNILYGYLGSAMGIGDTTLYWGGGIAANKYNIFNGKAYNPDEYYGDNKKDHEYIKKGIEMFYEDYPDAKAGINRTFP